MKTEQCISVTELSKNTSSIIRNTSRLGTQFVFVNNKPQAVILSMEQYEHWQNKLVGFGITNFDTLSTDTKIMYTEAKNLPKEEFIDV